MISPRLARRIASLHKWLGLIVGVQLLVWTGTGLFFTVFAIPDIRGDGLLRTQDTVPVDMTRVKLSSTEALAVVVEDQPIQVTLRTLADEPVYEIRSSLGVFLVGAGTGQVMSPIGEDLARRIALSAWAGKGGLVSMERLDAAPREAGGGSGPVWAGRFEGSGHPVLYVSGSTGRAGPVRTDLWRTYDFLWSLHIMDYRERENFNHPLIIAAAVLALSVVLFGIALLLHRFTRGLVRPS
jgi:hypothetical protein